MIVEGKLICLMSSTDDHSHNKVLSSFLSIIHTLVDINSWLSCSHKLPATVCWTVRTYCVKGKTPRAKLALAHDPLLRMN